MPRYIHHHRRGYTLVLTLLVLILAAGTMAGVCRHSLRQTLAAARAEEELQRRWGELSCRSVFLPAAERILSRAEATTGKPVASVTRQFMMGEQRFTIVVSDEQAKVNVNDLYTDRCDGDRGRTEISLRALLQSYGAGAQVALKPTLVPREAARRIDAPRAFCGLGQVFANEPAEKLLMASAGLTCWGDGKLNFRRADEAGLKHLCSPMLDASGARKLHALGTSSSMSLGDALEELNLPLSQEAALGRLLTHDSSCQSLWIIVGTSQRNWYYLSVDDLSRGGSGGVVHFQY